MAFRLNALSAALVLLAWSAHADCIEGESCESGAAAASGLALLQVSQPVRGKSTIAEEQAWQSRGASAYADAYAEEQALMCTGVSAQGVCWYLSELAQTCEATCAAKGFNFSYVLADGENPVTPALVGHEPSAKQAPWAALECYAPNEDRYHTANANAAKHVEQDHIEKWSHENCRLACPCAGQYVQTVTAPVPTPAPVPVPTTQEPTTQEPTTQEPTVPVPVATTQPGQCTWKQPPACAPQFIYNGVAYAGCATVDSQHNKPWCQHHYQHTEANSNKGSEVEDWSYCSNSCDTEQTTPTPMDNCVWTPASTCVREYDYEGAHYIGCSSTDHYTPWCSNSNPYSGSWNNCVYSCPGKTVVEEEPLCSWQFAPECSQEFTYKGTQYTSCATVDNPTPWCSKDRVHKGEWSTCTKVCAPPQATVKPVYERVPVAPVSNEEPCARQPKSENDLIGATVQLDERGFTLAASSDSPINMKRFVCRVLKRIGCKATDLPSLMAFVPYYSGTASQQTYWKLKAELTTLCKAGGKWVIPKRGSE